MFCQCGCGGITTIVKNNYTDNGRIKGEYSHYIYGHHLKFYRGPGGHNSELHDKNAKRVSRECGSIRLAMLLADRNLKKRIKK